MPLCKQSKKSHTEVNKNGHQQDSIIKEEQIDEYDLDKFPPNVQEAEKHGKSSRCFKDVEDGPQDYCPCCGQNANNEPIAVCSSVQDLVFLGQGFPLFFDFSLWCKRILIMAFVIYGLYAILSNAAGGDCVNQFNSAYIQLQAECCQQNSIGNTECSKTKVLDISFCQNLIGTQLAGLNHVCSFSQGFQSTSECCQSFCKQNDQQCHQDGIHPICLPNKQFHQETRMVQSIILVAFVIIFKIIMQIMRRQQRQTEFDCDKAFICPSDYTAIISNLPSKQFEEKDLKQAVYEYCHSLNLQIQVEIVKITFSYDVSEYVEIVRKLKQYKLEIRQAQYYFNQKGKYPKKICLKKFLDNQRKIQTLNAQKYILDQKIEGKTYIKSSTLAFVTFKTKKGTIFVKILELGRILGRTKQSPFEFCLSRMLFTIGLNYSGFVFQGNLLTIDRAPQPDDIFWENCGVNSLWNKIKTYLVALALLILSFGIVLVLKYGQIQMINQEVNDKFSNQAETQNAVVSAISVIISLFVVTFNKIIAIYVSKFSLKENHTTRTDYMITTARKMIVAQFVNSALLIIAANVLMNYIYFQDTNNQQENDQRYINRIAFERSGGVVDDYFQVAAQTCVGPPLVTYLNVRNCFKVMKKWKIKSRLDAHTCITTQAKANKIFEGNAIDIAGYYAHIITSMWITFFFASLVPIGIIVIFFGLILFFWVQKYLVTQVYTRPFIVDNALNRSMLDMLQYSMILFSLGSIWFDYIFNQDSGFVAHILNYVALGLSVMEFFYPGERLNKRLFFNKPSKYQDLDTFETQQQYFVTDYDRLNPITRVASFEKYLKQFHGPKLEHQPQTESQAVQQGLSIYAKHGGTANHNFNHTEQWWNQELLKYNIQLKKPEISNQNPKNLLTNSQDQVQMHSILNPERQFDQSRQKINKLDKNVKNYSAIQKQQIELSVREQDEKDPQ